MGNNTATGMCTSIDVCKNHQLPGRSADFASHTQELFDKPLQPVDSRKQQRRAEICSTELTAAEAPGKENRRPTKKGKASVRWESQEDEGYSFSFSKSSYSSEVGGGGGDGAANRSREEQQQTTMQAHATAALMQAVHEAERQHGSFGTPSKRRGRSTSPELPRAKPGVAACSPSGGLRPGLRSSGLGEKKKKKVLLCAGSEPQESATSFGKKEYTSSTRQPAVDMTVASSSTSLASISTEAGTSATIASSSNSDSLGGAAGKPPPAKKTVPVASSAASSFTTSSYQATDTVLMLPAAKLAREEEKKSAVASEGSQPASASRPLPAALPLVGDVNLTPQEDGGGVGLYERRVGRGISVEVDGLTPKHRQQQARQQPYPHRLKRSSSTTTPSSSSRARRPALAKKATPKKTLGSYLFGKGGLESRIFAKIRHRSKALGSSYGQERDQLDDDGAGSGAASEGGEEESDERKKIVLVKPRAQAQHNRGTNGGTTTIVGSAPQRAPIRVTKGTPTHLFREAPRRSEGTTTAAPTAAEVIAFKKERLRALARRRGRYLSSRDIQIE